MKKAVLFAMIAAYAAISFAQSNNSVFDNAVYFRLGYGFPGGDLKAEEVITAGGQFEAGTVFYVNALDFADKFKTGIDVTYVSVAGYIHQKNALDNNQTNSYFTAGIKAGPCLSYNFAGEWIADGYFKLFPHAFVTGEHDTYYADTQYKLGTSLGLNIRYKALILGCEFTSGKYDFDYSGGEGIQNVSKKLPTTLLSLGVKL